MLGAFLQQMTQAQAGQKDTEAEALIREACARQPDATYLLVQRAMGLDFALQAAQAQVTKQQAELEQLRAGKQNSFFSDPNAWGRSTANAVSAAPPASNQAQAPLAPLSPATLSRGGAAAAPFAAAPASSWGGAGLLGTIATTAAGVVAGSFLYQGIQGMMNHHSQTADASAHAVTPAAEPEHLAAGNEAQDYSFDDAADYAEPNGGDVDAGDSA